MPGVQRRHQAGKFHIFLRKTVQGWLSRTIRKLVHFMRPVKMQKTNGAGRTLSYKAYFLTEQLLDYRFWGLL